jgi:hypothetical protein
MDERHLGDECEALDALHQMTRTFSESVDDLTSQARGGNKEARAKLIEGLMELAAILSIRLAPSDMPCPDAIQIGINTLKALIEDTDLHPIMDLAQAVSIALNESGDLPKAIAEGDGGDSFLIARRTETNPPSDASR